MSNGILLNAAILGFGTIGGGVFDVLGENAGAIFKRVENELRVTRVLEKREITRPDVKPLQTTELADILNDRTIAVCVETIGGAGFAYDAAKALLKAGKSVVTSNKELVSKHGAELVALAVENGVNYMFEAAVCGGIPIIRAFNRCITADFVTAVSGVFNGTTNFILTEMDEKGLGFDEALKEAQRLGYAEADPSYDVGGKDSAFKLSILLSLVTGRRVNFEEIYTEGIGRITVEDLRSARESGFRLKLVARGDVFNDGSVSAFVMPGLVREGSALASVSGVVNAVTVTGAASGELTFMGAGAGKRPTATAVLADVIECARHYGRGVASVSRGWSDEPCKVRPFDDGKFKRINGMRVVAE